VPATTGAGGKVVAFGVPSGMKVEGERDRLAIDRIVPLRAPAGEGRGVGTGEASDGECEGGETGGEAAGPRTTLNSYFAKNKQATVGWALPA